MKPFIKIVISGSCSEENYTIIVNGVVYYFPCGYYGDKKVIQSRNDAYRVALLLAGYVVVDEDADTPIDEFFEMFSFGVKELTTYNNGKGFYCVNGIPNNSPFYIDVRFDLLSGILFGLCEEYSVTVKYDEIEDFKDDRNVDYL